MARGRREPESPVVAVAVAHPADTIEQAAQLPHTASPDAHQPDSMDKKSIGHPKLSRGRSFLSRKSVKNADSQEQLHSDTDPQSIPNKGKERAASEDNDHVRPLFPSRSIIPDPLNELPAWFLRDHDGTLTSAAHFRARYPIHNPVGPRWYRNHHLSPPSLEKRPPSFFSPSFPPMAASIDRTQEKHPGPSRTPSGSPLPTPSSSQTRIHDVRIRTRKISQTAHDTVDLLDITDPWGTNWHHHSPYDVGQNHDKASPDAETPVVPRPRRMSATTGGSRHKTVTPSPLSQSTSAVHLAIDPSTIQLPRKLSKNRKTFQGLFTGDAQRSHPPRHASEPPTPMEQSNHKFLKRGSTVSPTSVSSPPSLVDKKEKRGSILGRLVKRFSVMRRTDPSRGAGAGADSRRSIAGRASVDTHPVADRPSPTPNKGPSQQLGTPDHSRLHGQAPNLQEAASAQHSASHSAPKEEDVRSVLSVDAPFSIGKLTIANPDEPGSSDAETPVEDHKPLPYPSKPQPSPEKEVPPPPVEESPRPVLDAPLSSSPVPLETPSPVSPYPVHSRLSTILSASVVDHPNPPTSPPLPDLPPPTPAMSPPLIPSEHSLPPTPTTTRPPSPSDVQTARADVATAPGSPEMRSRRSEILSFAAAKTPSALSAFQASLPEIDESPLARASMFVNPPTPLPRTISMPPQAPEVPSVPAPSQQRTPHSSEESKLSRNQSPSKREDSQKREESHKREESQKREEFQKREEPHRREDSQKREEPKRDKDSAQRVKSSSSSSKTRHTETFKLIRSPSGNIHTVGESFVVEGEHWGVVETPPEESKKVKRERTKSKEVKDANGTSSRRESRKHDKSSMDEDDEHKARERHRRSESGRHHHDSSSSSTRVGADSSRRPDGPERRRSSQKAARESSSTEVPERRRSQAKDSRSSQATVVRSTQTPVVHNDKADLSTSSSRRDRKPSMSASTRPTSDIQSGTDFNALKAKEAWDLERLWKGHSMLYGPDGTTLVSARPTIGSDSRPSTIMSADIHRAASIPSVADLRGTSPVPPSQGSSHTYFMVQAPYPSQPNGTTHPQAGVQSHQATRRDHSKHYRSLADHVPFPTSPESSSSRRLSNPLPDPPRISAYKPSPLPPTLANASEPTASPDYWTKYAGISTTLH